MTSGYQYTAYSFIFSARKEDIICLGTKYTRMMHATAEHKTMKYNILY